MESIPLIAMLDGWVREAVACHGDDWTAVMAALEEKLDGLGAEQRAALSGEVALLLDANSNHANSEPH
jgi:hypothetical protein